MKGEAFIISFVIFIDMAILNFLGWVVFLVAQPFILALLVKLAMNAMPTVDRQPVD